MQRPADAAAKGLAQQQHSRYLEAAARIMTTAEIVVVIGTSLNVYPAAGLLQYAPANVPIWLIDPKPVSSYRAVTQIQKGASEGMKELISKLDESLYQVVFEGKTYDIAPEKIDYSVSFTNKLNQVMKKQNAHI